MVNHIGYTFLFKVPEFISVDLERKGFKKLNPGHFEWSMPDLSLELGERFLKEFIPKAYDIKPFKIERSENTIIH